MSARQRRTGRAPAPAPRRRRWIVPALLAAATVAGLAGWAVWRGGSPPAPAGPRRPDVLLVTIDTLRADRLGCYGWAGAKTPVVDGLAARGARFAETVAQSPLTLPSHASIFTGVTPLVHGVRDNAGFRLGDSLPTVAETFAGAGYETAAFVSGFPVHRRFGLNRGFSTYDDLFPRGTNPSQLPYVERPADQTVAAAVRWLEARRAAAASTAAPVFAWLHLYDPHAPYAPPETVRSAFPDRPYDGEVAFADEQVGLLLDRWQTLRGQHPLVAVTSDHGEGLGDHGEPTHGLFIYDSTIRIPLILAGPGVPAGILVRGTVSSIDIAPTLLDLAGMAPMANIEGATLRPALESGRASGGAAYSESLFGLLGFGWAPLYGWREGGLMFIDAPRAELYDLGVDPGQAKNLAAERPGDVARMRRAVQALVAKAPEAKPGLVPRETREQLRSLGYVASTPSATPSLKDPKDLAALAVRIENAMATERLDPARAASEFRAALREDPGNHAARRHLAMALAAGREHEAAVRELLRLRGEGDESLETLTLLGDAYRLSGRPVEALAAFRLAAARHPAAPEGFAGQGKALMAMGKADEARQAFEQALRVAPDDPDVLEGLADLALARGDTAAARAQLDALAARAPGDSRAALKHGVVLVRSGELDRAIGIFREVLQREPGNAEAAVNLGGALAKAGRPAEAVPHFERAIEAGARGHVVWNGLAIARLETGNRAGAARALAESLRANPNQPKIRELLAQLR